MLLRLLLVLALLAVPAAAGEEPVNRNPTAGAAPLPAESGWKAHLCPDNKGVGVWTVEGFDVLPSIGSDEVVALDDLGRLYLVIPYSGRWSPVDTVSDGAWPRRSTGRS